MKRKIVVGITKEDEIYLVEIENGEQQIGSNSFSVCGNTVAPVSYESAKNYSYQYYMDFFEEDKCERASMLERFESEVIGYIQEGKTLAEACTQIVLDIDGEIHGFDNSLEPEEFEVDGKMYLFESGSCGQHDEFDNLKTLFIPEPLRDWIVKHWKINHLKKPLSEKAMKILTDYKQPDDFLIIVAKQLIKDGKERRYEDV